MRNLSWNNRLKDVSLGGSRRRDRRLGGLDGQGQRELLLALFGVMRGTTGEVRIDGQKVALGGPSDAKRNGVGMALIPKTARPKA